MSLKIAVLGASGYSGAETLRLLALHPNCEISVLTAETSAGKRLSEVYQNLGSLGERVLQTLDDAKSDIESCDVVFSCLPHGAAMNILPGLGSRFVIDLGSDFRLTDASLYDHWYGRPHTCADQLPGWVYGLPELFRTDIKKATRIANPGCYPTAVVLAIAPLLRAKMVQPEVIVSAVSGTSGAGRAVKPGLHKAHVYENIYAYKPGMHQHTPEMEMALSRFSDQNVLVSFTPHVGPYVRGIHATCSAALVRNTSKKELLDCLRDTYASETFVQVMDEPPSMKSVRAANVAMISAAVDERTGRAIVLSVIDNLTKGAAGQAIQNMNILAGFEETLGLPREGVYP